MEDLAKDLEIKEEIVPEMIEEEKELIIRHVANGNNSKRKGRPKNIEDKQEKIERILFYLEQEYTEDSVRDLIGPFLDKKTLDILMSEAIVLFNEPKPVENRLKALENKCEDLYVKTDKLLENFAYIQDSLDALQKTLEGGARRRG